MKKVTSQWTPLEEKIAKSLPYLDIDKMWHIGGTIGRYQVVQLCLVTWYTMASSFHLFSYIFLGYEPDHVCSTPDNISEVFDGMNTSLDVNMEKCSIAFYQGNQSVGKLACVGHNYSMPKDTSVLSEWDYVCDNRDLGQLPQSLFLAGQGLGAALSIVADYIGRRKTLIASHIFLFILTFSQAFVQRFWIFTALRFLTGALQQGSVLSAWIYLVELFPTNRRFFLSFFDIMSWAISMLTLGAIAYILHDYGWRTLEIALSFAAVHAIFLYFFMEESLRWMIVKEKTEDSVKLLKKICRVNNIPLEKILLADKRVNKVDETEELLVLGTNRCANELSNADLVSASQNGEVFKNTCEESDVCNGTVETERKRKPPHAEGLCAFLRDPKLLCQSSIVWFAWFVNVMVYFGLFLMPSLTINNRFLQYVLNSAMEIPSAIIMAISIRMLRRKTICIITHLVGGIVLLASSILFNFESAQETLSLLITILVLIGKIAIGTSFYFLFLYTPELFPTYMRNTGLGVASFCGRFGGVIAPFSFTLANVVPWAPGVVFGICCIAVGVLVRFVSETSDKPLPQKTREMKSWEEQTEAV